MLLGLLFPSPVGIVAVWNPRTSSDCSSCRLPVRIFSLSEKYKDIKGVSAIGEILEDKIQYTIMIDFDEADFDQLVENGLLNTGEVESQYISLKKTKEAYQNNGYACENQ